MHGNVRTHAPTTLSYTQVQINIAVCPCSADIVRKTRTELRQKAPGFPKHFIPMAHFFYNLTKNPSDSI